MTTNDEWSEIAGEKIGKDDNSKLSRVHCGPITGTPREDDIKKVDLAAIEKIDATPTLADYAKHSEEVIRSNSSGPVGTWRGNGARSYQIGTGPVFGLAGTTKTVVMSPQCLFRGEKLVATDTGKTPGAGTRILNLFVGQKTQFPPNANLPTSHFSRSQSALSSGVRMDTCDPSCVITTTISFIESCTFDMQIFGKAIL